MIRNFASLLVPKSFKVFAVLFIDALIARELGNEGFGLYSLMLAILMSLAMLVRFGLDNVMVRDTVRGKMNSRRVAQVWVVRVCAGLVAQFVFVSIIFAVPGFREYQVLLVPLSFSFVFFGIAIFESQMQGDEKFGLLGIVQTVVIIVGGGIKLFFLIQCPRLEFFWLSFGGEAVVSVIITAIYLRKVDRLPKIQQFSGSFFKAGGSYAREGLPFLLSGLSVMAFMRIDQFMLAAISGASSVGSYSAALRISESFFALATLGSAAMFPVLLRLKSSSTRDFERGFVLSLRVLMVFALTISLLLTMLAKPAVHFVYGAEYEPSAALLGLHGWVMLPAFWGVLTHRWIVAEHLGRFDLYRNMCGLGVNIIANLVLIPLYGAAGACVATILGQFVAYVGVNMVFRRLRPLMVLQLNAVFPRVQLSK